MNFQTWLPPLKPGVCSLSIPSLIPNGTTYDSTREKAECLNSMFASKYCLSNPSLHTQVFLDSVSFAPQKVEKVLSTLNSD